MSADRLSDQTAELRRRAEEELREKLGQEPPAASPGFASVAPADLTLHELQIHQIELEMQNEELRRSQEALEISLVRYFDLYDQAPLCYLTLSEKGLILEANLAAATLLGMDRRTLAGRVLSQSIAKDELGLKYREIFYMHHKKLFETGLPQSCEICMEKAGGTGFWVQISSTLAKDASGKPIQRVILSDIDQRKRAELALKFLKEDLETQVMNRTAEVRNLAISVTRAEERERQLIAHDLHDGIGQLLHVILLKSEGLYSQGFNNKSQVLAKDLDDLLREAIRMVGSVTSRLSPPVLATFGLVPAFSWLAEDLMREYGLRVHLECEEMPASFPEELSLILFRSVRELLINVAKHSGKLEAWLGLSIEPAQVNISINDLGIGMIDTEQYPPPEQCQLRPSEHPRAPEPAGWGDEHDFDTRGGDSGDAPVAPSLRPFRPPGVGMSIRILIADDHRMFRESLRLSLSESGQVEIVGEAGCGEETLREVARLKPDLILLDISLPDINGIDLARKLRQSFPDLKIIALTAHTDRLFVEAMLKAGAQGYLVKTASTKDLLTAIQMVEGGRNFLCVEAMQALVRRQGDEGKAELSPSSILGRRELEVLKLLAQGLASTLISARLNIAVGTVEVHRRNIMRKLGIHTAVDLTRYAIRKGLISA